MVSIKIIMGLIGNGSLETWKMDLKVQPFVSKQWPLTIALKQMVAPLELHCIQGPESY
jgi:hypothetical protein